MTKFCSEFHEIMALRQNRVCKQEVGHGDLTFTILKSWSLNMLHMKFEIHGCGGLRAYVI